MTETSAASSNQSAARRPVWRMLTATARDLNWAQSWLLLAPVAILYFFVFLLPVIGIVRLSLFDPDLTLDHYRLLTTEPLFLSTLWRTIWISATVTALALLLGYPVAALLTVARGRWAPLAMACVLVPLWLSILVRSYAWVVILSRNGVLSEWLRAVGLIGEDTRLIYNDGAVILAMVHVLLPFMILPLYAALRAIPGNLTRAAMGLGANRVRSFCLITFPLSLPGVFSGSVLVFVVSLGFFVTPQLVGGPNSMMAAMLISREATYGNNWGLASALATVLFAFSILVVMVFGRFTRSPEGRS